MIIKWSGLYRNFSKLITVTCLVVLPATQCLFAGEIHDAAAAGDLGKVKSLLESDITLLESKDSNGNTPLNVACGAFHVATAHFLIDMGANINVRNNYGLTTLHLAIGGKGRDLDLILKLISKGADVNARLDRGLTALHFAAMTDNLKVVQLLIDRGADLNASDNICYGTVLHTAINISPNDEIAKLLVERGAKINQKFSFGNTELHLAAMKGYSDLVLLLIKHGADIQTLNSYNHTPVYYSARHGYRKTTDTLIAAGAKKSDITETNYGKAAQLTAELKDGEAHLWYLGGFYGGGYAVKTKNNLIIFDKSGINESEEASLANGNLNPKELEGQKITVLITKPALNYEKQVLDLAKKMNDVHWVFDTKSVIKDTVNTTNQFHLPSPNETLNVNGITIHTIPAIGRGNGGATGVGYIVEADRIKIFHSGFHVAGYESSQIESYQRKIDSLKSFGPIDIAILTVSGHLTVNYEPYLYLIDQLSPKAIFLMGGDAATEEYPKCVSALQVRNVPVKYPESGRALGERFHYVNSSFGQQFTDLYGDYLGQTPPGDIPVVFAPGFVSRYSLEHGPAVFSPDGNEVYWAWRDNPSTICHIWYMKRINNHWTKPENFAPFGDTVTHWDPFLSLDGKRLYFSALNYGKADIWFVEKQGKNWGKPQNIGPVINNADEDQCQAILNKSGTVYFSAGKIVKSKFKNENYFHPDTLPVSINQGRYNSDPYIAPDDSYLLFCSRRLNDQVDIYISFHDTIADTWSEPINMGKPINTMVVDRFPAVSPDGKYLFFTRYNVNEKSMDVYWVSAKIIDRLRKNRNVLMNNNN